MYNVNFIFTLSNQTTNKTNKDISPHLSKHPFQLFIALTVISAAFNMTTNRYTAPIPDGAIVAETREHLNSIVRHNPATVLYDETGGFLLKDGNGVTIAVAADALIPELENAIAEADALTAKEKPEAESASDDKKGGGEEREARNQSVMTKCSHSRRFDMAICLFYTNLSRT